MRPWPIFALAAAMLATALAAPASARPVDAARLEYFLDRSYSSFDAPFGPGGADSFEDMLYAAAEDGAPPETVIERFARALDVPAAEAADYAELIIDSVELGRACSIAHHPERCDTASYPGLTERLASVGLAEPSGRLLISISENLNVPPGQATLLEIARRHPRFGEIALEAFGRTNSFTVFAAAAAEGAAGPDLLGAALASPPNFTGLLYERLAVYRQMFDAAPAGEARVLAGLILVRSLLRAGLSEEALAVRDSFSAAETAELEALLDRAAQGDRRTRSELAGLVTDLAAARLEAGEADRARALLDRLHMLIGGGSDVGRDDIRRAALIREAMDPRHAGPDLFNLMIFGAADGTPQGGRFTRNPGGLLWSAAQGVPAVQHVVSAYLTDAGYPQMADYVLSPPSILWDPLGERLTRWLGSDYARLREDYAAQMEDVRAEMSAGAGAPPADAPPRPVYFTERPLPEGVTPAPADSDTDARPEPPEGLPDHIHPYSLVRVERDGAAITALYVSQQLDPVGEVSRGGYWAIRSPDAGRSWGAPRYLGLQQYFPYVAVTQSELPLWADGRLQIEVRVQELDRSSITFPPVGLRAARRADGLYLDFAWDDLVRDGDGDGLSDIVEHRIGLDPANRDSDGDLIADGRDSLPLAPLGRGFNPDADMIGAIFEQITRSAMAPIVVGMGGGGAGDSAAALLRAAGGGAAPLPAHRTRFYAGDPALFAGLDFPDRLMTYDQAALARIDPSYGAFYPTRLTLLRNPDGSQVYVIWSAQWRGGEFLLTRTPDGFDVESYSNWIT